MSSPAISIITPVYNGLPFLRECIESVLIQDFQDWEMLISDDGSNDETRVYLDTLNDPRIKVYKQEKNLGIFGNLNFLFSKARSSISQILCQDDYMLNSSTVSVILSYWQSVPSDVGFVRYNHKADVMCQLTKYENEIIPAIVSKDNADLYFFLFGNIPGNLSNVSLRTEIVNACGGFDIKLPYAGDFDFWSRANKIYSMGIQNESIIYVRRHAGVASIFLNKKGELIAQKGIIVNRLYTDLLKKYSNIKFSLKLHGTINYDTLQRDTAVRLFLRGKRDYLNELEKVSHNLNFLLNMPLRWALFFATLGGRIGRVLTAKQVLNHIQGNK